MADTRTGKKTASSPIRIPENLPFPSVAIIGSGFGGLCMAIKLQERGFKHFTIFEKEHRVGGTWRDNSYPGSACDVPSHLYSFSFAPKSDWSRMFPPQDEILAYIDHVADRYALREKIRFNTEIESAIFDEDSGTWHLRTKSGEDHFAHILVAAMGQLNRPAFPSIKGRDSFRGHSFHSARWDHEYRLKGKNIAVIGTGASAIQFVPPVADEAKKLYVFQRTPAWILPKPDRQFMEFEKKLFAQLPVWRWLNRNRIYWSLEARFGALQQDSILGQLVKNAALQHLEDSIKSPGLRKALTPDYELGCKRILITNDYYPAMERPNVELVTTPIEKITGNAVVTTDGIVREVDTIIYGTGFQSTGFLAPVRITGTGGRDLHEVWKDGAEAYYGITVSGFPNLFMLYGPNTNLGHNSILFMIECQVHYIMQCVERLTRTNRKYLYPKEERQREYNQWVQGSIKNRVWASGCSSWYVNESGKVTNNWPTYTVTYWRKTRNVDFSAYEMV